MSREQIPIKFSQDVCPGDLIRVKNNSVVKDFRGRTFNVVPIPSDYYYGGLPPHVGACFVVDDDLHWLKWDQYDVIRKGCEQCNWTGEIVLFTSTVPCDCVIKQG